MKRKVHYRNSGDWYDLYGDERFKHERLKGKDKKHFQKRTRRRLKREVAKIERNQY